MDRSGFVTVSLVAFGFVLLSFFVRGFGQLLVGRAIAQWLQAPFALLGFALLVYLFVRAVFDALGLWSIEES